ncbi:MAG: ferrochelatase, partial [Planctomycetaceae bacterium]|nr:ferrochelatase [Planctomycetaceae bacterium]
MKAFLLVSYGAPESSEDVVPFLQNLFRGKSVPPSRIAEVAEKYHTFAERTGHYSPLNNECRELLQTFSPVHSVSPAYSGLRQVYWGNLFWHPLLPDVFAEMHRDGITEVVYFVSSAFDSHTANRRYDEAISEANQPYLLKLSKFPLPYRYPLFVKAQANALLTASAWAALDSAEQVPRLTLFSAHSIPNEDTAAPDYVKQLQESCTAVADVCGVADWELVFQSRSGAPNRWLGPDIRDRIRDIAAEGKYSSVTVSPIGFFFENMETVNDLDIEVAELCKKLNIGYYRARTVGTSPEIAQMLK